MNDTTPHALKYRALTDEQKRDVIERLYQIWLHHSELRLGQLLSIGDLYYIEDFDLVNRLEQHTSPARQREASSTLPSSPPASPPDRSTITENEKKRVMKKQEWREMLLLFMVLGLTLTACVILARAGFIFITP